MGRCSRVERWKRNQNRVLTVSFTRGPAFGLCVLELGLLTGTSSSLSLYSREGITCYVLPAALDVGNVI